MLEKLRRGIVSMEFEDQLYHIGVLLTMLGVVLPWFEGRLYGQAQQLWTGFGFYTGYIGLAVFLVQIFLVTMTLSPILGGPSFIRRSLKTLLRLYLSSASLLALLCAFSFLLSFSLEVAGTDMRMGISLSIIGTAFSVLYASLRFHQQRVLETRELFHHPDDALQASLLQEEDDEKNKTPPPPPPSPPSLEDHHNIR